MSDPATLPAEDAIVTASPEPLVRVIPDPAKRYDVPSDRCVCEPDIEPTNAIFFSL